MDVSKSKTDAFQSAINPKVRKIKYNKIIIKGKKTEKREIFGSVTGGLVKDRIGAYVNNVIPYFDSPPVK